MDNPLEYSLGFQMVVAARSMKRALEVKLSDYGVTASQYVVLEILWKNNGISLTELGKTLHFDNPTMTGIINRMARAKTVRRHRDRNDRRVIRIYLTQKGRELQNILPRIAQEINSIAVENFHEHEKAQILNLAKRVRSNLKNNS